MRKFRVLLVALFLLFSCHGFPPVIASDSPPARIGHRMIYDPVNMRTILLGGAIDDNGWRYYRDMWSYDATTNTWSEITTSGGPSGRFNFQMTYSVDHQKIVVFSAAQNSLLADTWVYDVQQNSWERKRPDPSPVQRGDAGFVYDESNKVFIMYGGLSDVNPERILDETWVYDIDENTWTEMTPENSPPRSYGGDLVYDSLNQKVLLWGGNIGDGDFLDEFWCYDYQTNTWTRIETNPKPRGRYWQQMTFDPDIGKVVIFGGAPPVPTMLRDTWLYDYTRNEWTEIVSSDNPSASWSSRMVYDSEIGKVVLFGGTSGPRETYGDTWILDTVNGEWSIAGASEPISTEGQEGSTEGQDDESGQTGIPGFPLPSIILSIVLIMILLADGRRSSNGVISAQAG